MPAKPARPVNRIEVNGAERRVHFGAPEYGSATIGELSRVEIIRLMSQLNVPRDDKAFPTAFTVEEMVERIHAAISKRGDGVVEFPAIKAPAPKPAPMPIPIPPARDVPPAPQCTICTPDQKCAAHRSEFTPAPELPPVKVNQPAAPAVGKSAPPVADAVQSLLDALAASAGAVDETAVIEIVERELGAVNERIDAIARPVINEIRIGDAEVVKIEGRTHQLFDKVLRIAKRGEHVYLVGPPGTGKTTLAEQIAVALGRPFSTKSCYATMPTSEIWGYRDANGNYHAGVLRNAYENGGVLLLDEMDNGHPGILAALNQALANGGVQFPDVYVKRHPDFVCIAAANTFGTGPTAEFVGRNALDAATMDRFTMVLVPIDEDLEMVLAIAEFPGNEPMVKEWVGRIRGYRANAEAHRMRIVLSPRASISGARLLSAGFVTEEVLEMRVFRGIDDTARAKLTGGK